MKEKRLIKLNLEDLLNWTLEDWLETWDYILSHEDEEYLPISLKDSFISLIEHFLDIAKIVVIYDVPFIDRIAIKDIKDISCLIDDNYLIDWDYLINLAYEQLSQMGYDAEKVKKELEEV